MIFEGIPWNYGWFYSIIDRENRIDYSEKSDIYTIENSIY